MSDRSVTPPITADLAARVTPGPGTIVHRKPLTVVVSSNADADADRISRGITEVVEQLISAGDLSFGPVASGLQQFVVDHQPNGVAAVLDVAPDAIAFLFDQAVAIGDSTTHRASGRSGWTTVFVEGDSVSLVAGPGPERPVDPWSQLWAGTVAGQGVQVDLHRSSWSEPIADQPLDSEPIHVVDDIEPLVDVTAIAAAPAFESFPLAEPDAASRDDGAVDLTTDDGATANDGAVVGADPADVADPAGEANPAGEAEPDAPEVGEDQVGKEEVGEEEAGKDEVGEEEVGEEETGKEEVAEEDVEVDVGLVDDHASVIELKAEQIDLSSSSMPTWSWPPPVPEPAIGGSIEAMANTSARARRTGSAEPATVLDTPSATPAAEPIAGPPPMPAPIDAEPAPESIAPISGPPPMPGAQTNGVAPTDLPPPPPGAEPIAGPPPMPGAATRRADDDQSD